MNKKIFLIIPLILILLTSTFLIIKNIEENSTNQGLKFKKEYEKLNGCTFQEKNKQYNYLKVKIDKNNNIKYLTTDDLEKKLTTNTGIIYFGTPTSNYSRAVVPILLDVVKKNEIENIYYYDPSNLIDNYENDTSKKTTKIYENIVKILDKHITTTFNKNSKKSGQKKLTSPLVVFIKNGTIIGSNYQTTKSHKDQNKNLTTKEKKELQKIYQDLTDKMLASICTLDHEC